MAQIYTQPEDVVVGFYGLVDDKKFEEAFACLTGGFQQRVWNKKQNQIDFGLYNFKQGYQFLIAVPKDKIKYELIAPENSVGDVDVKVGYDEKKKILTHPSVSYMSSLGFPIKEGLEISNKEARLGNIDGFIKSVTNDRNKEALENFSESAKQFKQLLEDLGGDQEQINDFRLAHLFTQDAINKAVFLTGINYEENKLLFYSREGITKENFRAECVQDDKRGWLIDGLKYK